MLHFCNYLNYGTGYSSDVSMDVLLVLLALKSNYYVAPGKLFKKVSQKQWCNGLKSSKL